MFCVTYELKLTIAQLSITVPNVVDIRYISRREWFRNYKDSAQIAEADA